MLKLIYIAVLLQIPDTQLHRGKKRVNIIKYQIFSYTAGSGIQLTNNVEVICSINQKSRFQIS